MDMALYMYDDIMRMTENLNEKFIISNGATNTAYRCDLKKCKLVAIKRLYTHYPQSLREFETELETVGSIKHRSVLQQYHENNSYRAGAYYKFRQIVSFSYSNVLVKASKVPF